MSESRREQVFGDLERVMNWLSCGLMGSDSEGSICFINQQVLDWLGYEEHELIGKSFGRFLPPEIREHLAEEREAALAGDVRMRLTMLQRKNSTTLPVLVVPQRILDDDGEAVGTFSVLLDMGSVETAKPVDYRAGDELHERLERIARELQAIGLASQLPTGSRLDNSSPRLRFHTARTSSEVASADHHRAPDLGALQELTAVDGIPHHELLEPVPHCTPAAHL